MRFKNLGLERIILAISVVYILHLGVNGQLGFYIHPRYINFTFIMAGLCLLMLIVNSRLSAKSDDDHGLRKSSLIPLALVLAVAVVFPARSLTSSTVSQRTIDSGSIVTTSNARPVSSLFAGSSRGLKLADWSRLIETDPNPESYLNRPADVSGFVYDAGFGDNIFLLARFVLTCCAVDAQPVGVPVQIENWQSDHPEDSWVQIEGQFEQVSINGEDQLVLIPDVVEKIDEPSNPYAN